MTNSAVVSPHRPVVVTGRPALAPDVERYVVNGGGCAVFDLARDDVLELSLLEGGQTVELVAFNSGGKPETASLGVTAKNRPRTRTAEPTRA